MASGAAGRANVGLDLVADYFAPGEAAEYCICGFIGVSVCPCAYLRHHYCDRTSKLQRIFYAHDTCDSGLRLSKSYTGYQSRRGSSSSRACWSTKCYVNYDGLVYSLMQVYNRKKNIRGIFPMGITGRSHHHLRSFPLLPTVIPPLSFPSWSFIPIPVAFPFSLGILLPRSSLISRAYSL